MATTTPNYGWTVPTSSDLVKNGATAIETLGDSVDDSLWNSGFGQAGKNKIINGDFGIWQRGTSFSTSGAYCADRWQVNASGATGTWSQQTFTPATAPVAGYEGQFFLRMAITGADDNAGIIQKIENVRTFAGQTITVSFWAKGDTTRTTQAVFTQDFGSGGSASVITASSNIAITTAWARYSAIITLPSLSGKTIGTSSNLALNLRNPNNETSTIDFWGVQVEYGSKATPFQLAGGGDPQSELALCQRYYYRTATTNAYGQVGLGMAYTLTTGAFSTALPVAMRVVPTAIEFSTLTVFSQANSYTVSALTLDPNQTTTTNGVSNSTHGTGTVANNFYFLRGNNSTSAYIAYSAEL
jgi:hypothetical protein